MSSLLTVMSSNSIAMMLNLRTKAELHKVSVKTLVVGYPPTSHPGEKCPAQFTEVEANLDPTLPLFFLLPSLLFSFFFSKFLQLLHIPYFTLDYA